MKPDSLARPKVLIAPQAFKGTLTAGVAAAAIAAGVGAALPDAELVVAPFADGGDGWLDTMLAPTPGACVVRARVTGPLGQPVTARWALAGDLGLIEAAEACGLRLLAHDDRDALAATSRGVGELILAALEAGARRIWIGIGGTASSDGGAGMLQALGAGLLDAAGRQVRPGAAGLADLVRLDMSGLDRRVGESEIAGLTDVRNPLTGPHGAAAVFGRQKGAGDAEILAIEAGQRRLVAAAAAGAGSDIDGVPGAGAGGGLGAGVLLLGGVLRSGGDHAFEALGLDAELAVADLVITGEGSFDLQSVMGKGTGGLIERARIAGKPVIVIAGRIEPGSAVSAPLAIAAGIQGRVASVEDVTRAAYEAGVRWRKSPVEGADV